MNNIFSKTLFAFKAWFKHMTKTLLQVFIAHIFTPAIINLLIFTIYIYIYTDQERERESWREVEELVVIYKVPFEGLHRRDKIDKVGILFDGLLNLFFRNCVFELCKNYVLQFSIAAFLHFTFYFFFTYFLDLVCVCVFWDIVGNNEVVLNR